MVYKNNKAEFGKMRHFLIYTPKLAQKLWECSIPWKPSWIEAVLGEGGVIGAQTEYF